MSTLDHTPSGERLAKTAASAMSAAHDALHAVTTPPITPSTPPTPPTASTPTADSANADGKSKPGRNAPKPPRRDKQPKTKMSFMDRVEAFISRLSTKNNFFNRLCSLIWLPYAFHSGIKMKKLDENTYQAVLPFRRFNRNWYNAMAGAALLGNAEIAGGNFVFGICGGEYTVVCKNMTYKFLRPCMGPAIYRITPEEDIHALIETGNEFNTTIKMDIMQAIAKPGAKERRVGRAVGIFHVTPKHHQRSKGRF